MKRTALTAALAMFASLSACAIRPAEMARPASLDGAATFRIAGIGGGESGDLAVGPYAGQFNRSAQRLSFFELVNLRDGGARFRLNGPDLAVEAACTMRERTITIDIVEFRPAPMAYGCSFRDRGLPMAAAFEVQEQEQIFGDRRERRGAVMVDGVRLDVRSVHDVAGGLMPVSSPIGYVFERNGIAVGGVELNGDPMVFEAAGASAAERRAILLASVALSVFWDPANLDA